MNCEHKYIPLKEDTISQEDGNGQYGEIDIYIFYCEKCCDVVNTKKPVEI